MVDWQSVVSFFKKKTNFLLYMVVGMVVGSRLWFSSCCDLSAVDCADPQMHQRRGSVIYKQYIHFLAESCSCCIIIAFDRWSPVFVLKNPHQIIESSLLQATAQTLSYIFRLIQEVELLKNAADPHL